MRSLAKILRRICSREQRGNVLVYFAMGIMPFVAVTGLVIDYGEAVSCKTKMQKAVDAAALAGAAYTEAEYGRVKAEELAETNYTLYDEYDVVMNGAEVIVSMKRDLPTRFMRLLGKNSSYVEVKAKAIKPEPVRTLDSCGRTCAPRASKLDQRTRQAIIAAMGPQESGLRTNRAALCTEGRDLRMTAIPTLGSVAGLTQMRDAG